MPKMKSHSGAAKRFKKTPTGSVKRGQSHRSHILTKKGTKQKRNLTKTGLVHESDTPNIKQQLCM